MSKANLVQFCSDKRVKILRIAKGFKPYRGELLRDEIMGFISEPKRYGVLRFKRRLGCLVFWCDRCEGVVKIIVKDEILTNKVSKKK